MALENELNLYTVDLLISAIKAGHPLVDRAPVSRLSFGRDEYLVYFITCRDRVKIGHTRNLGARLRNLYGLCPYQLAVLGVLEGGRDEELKLHHAMLRYHSHCEWFSMSDRIERILCEHTFYYAQEWRHLGKQKPRHPGTSKIPSPPNIVSIKRAKSTG